MRAWVHRVHLSPYLRGAVVLYLLASVFLFTVHQHHGASYGHDCALCAAAQTPSTVPPSSPQIDAPPQLRAAVGIADDPRHESEVLASCRTRAPPRG